MNEIENILQGLSATEREAVIQILREQQLNGTSTALNSIVATDYDEIPVSMQEFITNPRYAGNYLQTYYDFWKEQLINIFDSGKHYSEIAFTGSIGTGKGGSPETPLLGPSGWFLMKDAKPGMTVIGEDGLPHRILQVHHRGRMQMYKVTFSDHSSIECSGDHIWTVRDYCHMKKQVNGVIYDNWVNKTTDEIIEAGIRTKSSSPQRRFAIPVSMPINFKPKHKGELPIHPYVLGQLISDGGISTDTLFLHAYENDVADKFNRIIQEKYGCELVHSGSTEDKYGDYRIAGKVRGNNPLVKEVYNLGLRETAHNKFIPELYLYASIEDRIQLLQGLFDGDGSIQDKRYTYSTVSKRLYEDMIFLIESLGGSVYRTNGKLCWRTKNGERVYTGSNVWEFQFKLPDAIKPFTSIKHATRYDGGTKFNTSTIYRFIDKIECIGENECICITVDNPSGLYVSKDFIVTHNSSMAIVGMGYVLYQLMCLKNPQKYWGTNKTIFFAFFNNNLELARSVGFAAFHDLIKKSEWFLEHGEFRGKVNQVYYPYKDIQLLAGSLPSHVIGKDVFCVDGDTVINTNMGCHRIAYLAGNKLTFKVKQCTPGGDIIWSENCHAVRSKYTNKVVVLHFENGGVITCTPEHLFIREQLDYVPASLIRPGDALYCPHHRTLSVTTVEYKELAIRIPVFDIVNAYTQHNFAIQLGNTMVFAHNCALQDELNFGTGSNVHFEQNKILTTYNAIYERIASRFTRDGINWGTMFLVSSKKSEYDFLESYIRRQKGKPHFYVADAKIWDVKPMGVYSGKKFNLAVGGSNLPSKIISDEEDPQAYERQGYEVIQVPIEHKQSFELDMQSALMNVAGISITHVLKFMNIEQIQKCYTDDPNPFVAEVLTIGLNDSSLIQDYFNPSVVPEEIYSRPIFIHLDMAVTGDNAGIGAVAAMGFVNTSEYSINEGKVVETRKMAYRHVFNVEISAPKNDQIHFAKVREFIYYLRFQLGWNIRGISADGFNCLTDVNKVITNNGIKRITELDSTVDKILSFDLESDGFVYTDFENLGQSGTTTELVRIYTGDDDFIECTPYHLILTSEGYIPAKDVTVATLAVNSKVDNSSSDKYRNIISTERITCNSVAVYDIEVPHYHNFVLADGSVVHNSVDMRQQLTTMGFHDVKLVSLDRTPDGYMALRSAIAERRISLLHLDHLEIELVQLERDNVTGKIDHPLTGCFTADTKISLVDGRELSIIELLEEFQSGKDNFVYSVNEQSGKIEPKLITNVFYTKTVDTLVVVTLDNGEIIQCTPDHKFMLRDGTYIEAQYLTSEMSLMPLYRKVSNAGLRGYRLYYEPCENCWHYEHRQFVSDSLKSGHVVHHKNFDKLDNCPTNLVVMTKSDHTRLHNRTQTPEERQKRSLAIKQWHELNRNTLIYQQRSKAISLSLQRNSAGLLYSRFIKLLKQRMLQLYVYQQCGKQLEQCSSTELASFNIKLTRLMNPQIQQRITAALKQNHKAGKYLNAYEALQRCNNARKGTTRSTEFKNKLSAIMASNEYKDKQQRFLKSLTCQERSEIFGWSKGKHWYNNGKTEILCGADDVPEGYRKGRINHKVTSIRVVNTPGTDVYDLTIQDNPNFALSAGVFVHNSKDGADGLAGALYNALLHEGDLANDLSDLVDAIVSVNAPVEPAVEVVNKIEHEIDTSQQVAVEEIIAEAKRRARIDYGRDVIKDVVTSADEPFNPSEGILF